MNADDELLERIADVLDRADPMPPDLITTGRAVFTADPTNVSAGQVPPCLPAETQTPAPPAGCNEAAGGADNQANQLRRWAITALKVIALFAGLAFLGFLLGVIGVGIGVLGTPA